jgi:hypothetical protein
MYQNALAAPSNTQRAGEGANESDMPEPRRAVASAQHAVEQHSPQRRSVVLQPLPGRFGDPGERRVGGSKHHVVPPTCTTLGGRWESGEVRVMQEHLASNLIRGRLLALARGWERGNGPMALFACRPTSSTSSR